MQRVCLSVCPPLSNSNRSLLQIRNLIFLRQRVHLFHFVLNKISGFLRGVPEDCNSAAPLSASDQFATQLTAVPNTPHHLVSSYQNVRSAVYTVDPLHLTKLLYCAVTAMLFSFYAVTLQPRAAPHPLLATNQPTAMLTTALHCQQIAVRSK